MTPNIVAATSGFAVERRARCASAMPAIAPAAFAMIRAETRLTPEMSTTEYIIVTSTAPTYGRVSPEATVETISFGTPTGSARIARGGDRRAARAAEREDPVEPPVRVEPRDDLLGAARHRRRPPRRGRPRAASSATSAPPARATSSARDVGLEADRLVDARVDDQHVDAVLEQPVAQERVLDALRVERAEQDDRRHPSARSASGSTPR